MSTPSLKEYLDAVVKLETIYYTEQRILSKLNIACSSVGTPFAFRMPDKPEVMRSHNIPVTIAGLACAVFFLVLVFMPGVGSVLVKLFFAAMALCAIIFTIARLVHESGKRRSAAASLDEYAEKLRQYNSNVERDKTRVQQELSKKYIILRDCKNLSVRHSSHKELLDRLYDIDIIFPKYRNFIMVSALYEYVCTGRCTKLEGIGEGYSILESGITAGSILTDMSRIEASPEAVKGNQFIVYRTVTAADHLSQDILTEEHKIITELPTPSSDSKNAPSDENRLLSAYCTKTAQECDRIKRMLDSWMVTA